MPATQKESEWKPFKDKRKIEYIDGQAYLMAPAGTWHNTVGGNIHYILQRYLRGKHCRVFYETKVVFDEENRFIPDLMVVCDRSKIKESFVDGAPDLVVEILSSSTRKNDIGRKKEIYEKYGVREYWIVNPREKTIDAYILRDGRLVIDGSYHSYTDAELEGMEEDEKAEAMSQFSLKVSLYDDLVVDLYEVFEE